MHGVLRSGSLRNPTTVLFLPWEASVTNLGMCRTTSHPKNPSPHGMPSGERYKSNMSLLSPRPPEGKLLLVPILQARIRPERMLPHSTPEEPWRLKKTWPGSRVLPRLRQKETCLVQLHTPPRREQHHRFLRIRCPQPRGQPPVVPWLRSTLAVCRRGDLTGSLWLLLLRQPMLRADSHNPGASST